MAKKVEQQTRDIREEARQEVQKELKVEGITPERKKKILGEWKEINIKLKEIELRNKKKEGYKHTFKRLEEFKQLNGKTVYSDAMGDAAQRDKDSMSLEMAYSQVDPMYRVVLEDMAKYIRPGVEKELLNKCKLDRGLIRDLTGIINVLKFIEIKDYSRAKTAFLYFQLGENRIKDIEQYFNVNLGSLFKDDIKQVYDTARELGISEKELAMNASTKMSSYSSQAEDMERSVTGADYATELVSNSGSQGATKHGGQRWATKAERSDYHNDRFINLFDNKKAADAISSSFLSASKSTESIKFSPSVEAYLSGPGGAAKREKFKKIIAMSTFAETFVGSIKEFDLETRRRSTEFAVEMITRKDHVRLNCYDLFMEKSELESKLEDMKNNGNDEDIARIEARIKEIDIETAGILSGKMKPSNEYRPSQEQMEIAKRISELKEESKRLKKASEAEQDPDKKAEIQTRLMEIKNEITQLRERIIPRSVKRVVSNVEKKTATTVATQVLDNVTDKGRTQISAAELDYEANQFIRTIRAGRMDRAEADKLIEDVGFGILDSEKMDRLQYITTSYSDEYIRQVQNEKSLPYLLSQIDNKDKHARESAIGAVLNYINERLLSGAANGSVKTPKNLGNQVNATELAELESAFNKVKGLAAGLTLHGVSIKAIEKYIEEIKARLAEKESLLENADSKFGDIQNSKTEENYVQTIKDFYSAVDGLSAAFKVNYSLEEIEQLQAKFDACEALIAEKGIKVDESLKTARDSAQKKINNLRQRTKLNIILDTTKVIKLSTREERVEALKNNLKYLIGLIRSGEMNSEDARQVRSLLVEYRKLRVLNWDLENGDNLQEIEDMISEVDEWSTSVSMTKGPIRTMVGNCRNGLDEVLSLVESGDFGPETVKKWADCKAIFEDLKKQLKIGGRIFSGFSEKYKKIEQAFKDKSGPSIKTQLIEIRDSIRRDLATKTFHKIDRAKTRYECIRDLGVPDLDEEIMSEIEDMLDTAQQERTARSKKGGSVNEQIENIGQEIKKMLNQVKDKGFEGFDEARFESLVQTLEKLKLTEEGKSLDESKFENFYTSIEELRERIANHKAGRETNIPVGVAIESESSETESPITETPTKANSGTELGDKKGKFTVAGPVESEGASREIEESPIPEPEGMGASKELEGKGVSTQEIENMQKK